MTDYIDRQAAIDAVMALMPGLTTADGTGQFDAEIYREQELVVDIGQVLNVLPPAEAESVKHGRWEFETAWQYKPCDGRGLERKAIFGTTKRTFNRLKCSGCKKVVVVDDTIHYAYCPHCGAKMEGEE